MNFCEAREQWMANDEWPFADRDAAWNYFFTAGMIAEHELNAASREELARLRERCKPSKVVMIGDAGHYVSEAVGAEIDQLRFTLAECKEAIVRAGIAWSIGETYCRNYFHGALTAIEQATPNADVTGLAP